MQIQPLNRRLNWKCIAIMSGSYELWHSTISFTLSNIRFQLIIPYTYILWPKILDY